MVTKNNIYRELPKKGSLGQFARSLAKNKCGGEWRGGGVDTSMHTMT